MVDYTALITAWNSVTQPPAGVTGTALTGGMTTAQKLAAVNAWTVAIPLVPEIPVSKIIGAIVPADLLGLTALQLQQLQFLLQSNQTVVAPLGGTIRAVFGTIFTGKATTLANLTALVAPFDNATQNWCAVHGYPTNAAGNGNLSISDTQNAGLV
jgi:hypothetical protein